MLTPTYIINPLPPQKEIETVPVLKALVEAGRALAELKRAAETIPNQAILINTLALQEAKASSEIENIVTTQDEIFQAELFPEGPDSPAAKEVSLYREALYLGFQRVKETDGLILNKDLIAIFQLLKKREDGFRVTPGTALKNERSGEIVFVPPQDAREIVQLMKDLEKFVNDDELCELDPLIKMALIHHQFESIHPFPDGNGRIGRILSVLYLTRVRLLGAPILYLSRAITRRKDEYYRLLQKVRDEGAWEEWILYMLQAVRETSGLTLALIEGMRGQMAFMKHKMRKELPKLYSQELLNNLFRHPYTKIEYVQADLNVTRQTAAKYLDQLSEKGFLSKHFSKRSNYYINTPLVSLFLQVSGGK